MKKIFTIALLAIVAMTANAQTKKWDFRNWSATTVANLQLGAGAESPANGWSDIEKAGGTAPTELSAGNCFWEVKAQGNASAGATLQANGANIAELEGLLYTNTTARSLAIAVNYQNANATDAAFQNYHGASYLWLGSSKKNYFVIPDVAVGTTIKMGVESHKNTDARGVELYVVKKGAYGTKGSKLSSPDGENVAAPTVYQDQEWLLDEEKLTDADKAMVNEDGTYDILIYNTNGCHLYYIDAGGSTPVVEGKNIAVISDGEGYVDIFQPEGNDYTTIDPSTASSKEDLEAYDAIIVGNVVKADDAIVPALKSVIARVPMINYSPALYAESVEMTAETVTVTDPENSLFADLSIDEDNQLASVSIMGTNYTVTLGDYFADDRILAKDGDAVAIHQHNPNRNSYIFIFEDADGSLLNNAINVVAATKKAVTAAATPTIAVKQKDGESEVTISCATSGAKIYYTVDGTEPTSASPVYTAAFTVTAETTVKAIAEADGFDPSAVATKVVEIATLAAPPVIAVAKNGATSTITITAEEGAEIYYSFVENSTAAQCAKYEGAIEISQPTYVYAFASAEGKLQSELAKAYAAIEAFTKDNIRLDVLAHCDFNETDYLVDNAENGGTGSAKAYYYWGKSAWKYYSEEIIGTKEVEKTDESGNVVKETENIYAPDPNAYKEVVFKTGWKITSRGQVLTGELQDKPNAYVGNGAAAYCAESALDLIGLTPSKGKMTFGGKTSGEPCSATIETTAKYQAPFDVVVFFDNANGPGKKFDMQIQVSEDGSNWETIGTCIYPDIQRYYKQTRVGYEENKEVYVRLAQMGGDTKGQVYDIYILNNGEESKKYDAKALEDECASGIADVVAKPARIMNGIYDLSGRRLQSVPSQGMYIINGKKYVK